jgi:hypothetical protein
MAVKTQREKIARFIYPRLAQPSYVVEIESNDLTTVRIGASITRLMEDTLPDGM